MRRWAAQCRLLPAADPRTADARDRLAAALRRPRAGKHATGRHRRLDADRRGTGACLDVPVEVVPMEELESVVENSSNGTVVTSRYFLQPVEELAKKHSVRAVAVDLNDFRQELAMLKELRPGSCVGLVSISPGILRAAEVILHSMRGNELLLMTATPDVGSRLLALLRASSHVLCDRPSLPLVEQSLRQNRSQLIRMPQVHCAKSYLSTDTINLLRKEIGLQIPAGAS